MNKGWIKHCIIKFDDEGPADNLGRRRFTLFWRYTANTSRLRGQCFFADPASIGKNPPPLPLVIKQGETEREAVCRMLGLPKDAPGAFDSDA